MRPCLFALIKYRQLLITKQFLCFPASWARICMPSVGQRDQVQAQLGLHRFFISCTDFKCQKCIIYRFRTKPQGQETRSLSKSCWFIAYVCENLVRDAHTISSQNPIIIFNFYYKSSFWYLYGSEFELKTQAFPSSATEQHHQAAFQALMVSRINAVPKNYILCFLNNLQAHLSSKLIKSHPLTEVEPHVRSRARSRRGALYWPRPSGTVSIMFLNY